MNIVNDTASRHTKDEDNLSRSSDNRTLDEDRANEVITTVYPCSKFKQSNDIISAKPTASAFRLEEERNINESSLPYSNNIEFVNYMETFYIKSQLEENDSSVFQLKNSRNNARVKFIVLDFLKKSTLSKRFSQEYDTVSAIAFQDDILFTGNHSGTVIMYSCEKEYKHNTYISKEIASCLERSVVCMDISQDGNYLITGYSNGYIALWEITTTKCLKLITNAHKTSVIACKFIRTINKKKFEVLSSDLEGNVIKIIIKDGLFAVSFEVIPIIKLDIPVFLISILMFSEEEKKIYDCCHTQALIVAFGCMDNICVFMLEPELKKLFKFDKPKYFQDNHVPDMHFGLGYLPSLKDTDCESVLDMSCNQTLIRAYKAFDITKPQVLLAISWGKIVFIYCLPITKNTIHQVTVAGHYINDAPIIRVGFISSSILFFFDSKKYVKVINTSLITPGEVRVGYDNERQIPIKDFKFKPELEEGRIVDPDIQYQNYVWDKREKTSKETYNNFIVYSQKNILLLGKKELYHGKLLTWDQSLTNLHQNSEWMAALILGLDIYHGRMTALADIPADPVIRKSKVGSVLKGLIHQYTMFSIGNDRSNVLSAEKAFQDRLGKCINICIEFCIEIEAIDYLLAHIGQIFDSKGYGDEFIQRLGPFILNNKFIDTHLELKVISTIIELYVRLKKLTVLSQVLMHLCVKSLNNERIKKICLECNLLTPLIYICMNGSEKEEDYFFPIERMYDMFLHARQIPKPIFVSYQNCLNTMPIPEIEASKQYIGHKMLWYINLCLDGDLYPDKTPMEEKKFTSLVVKISNWLLSESILSTLLNFDSFSLFMILTRLFKDQKILQILSDSINLPIALVDTIVSKCKELNNSFILQNMYEFIARITGTTTLILSKSLILEAGQFLLTDNSCKENPVSTDDFDMFNSSVRSFSKYLETMSNIIIEMIEKRKDLDENDYMYLLSASEVSQFVKVKIHLLKINKSYIKCLGVYLQKENLNFVGDLKVFEWIDETLRKLQIEDKQNYEALKEEVLNNLHVLSEFSIEGVTKLVEIWYGGQQDVVIGKLGNAKQLQLRYVENQLEKYKEDIEISLGGDNQKIFESHSSLLKLHIKLLCKLNKNNQVLPNLKKRTGYPVEECLKTCLKYKVYDAAIYLYQTLGAIKEAFDLAIEILNTTLNSIILELNSNTFSEKVFNEKIDCHKNNLRHCIEICQKHSEKDESNEEVWFLLLKQLYNVLEILKKNPITEGPKKQIEDFSKLISIELKDILDKMCYYVSIQRIIESVTTNYQDAEFKEFKKLLLNMLTSYSHLKNILTSAKKLLANSVIYNMIELKRTNMKGSKYILFKCNYCKKLFNHRDDEAIYVFRCGHSLHKRCVYISDNEVICLICFQNEIESSVTNTNISLITRKVSKELDDIYIYIYINSNQ